MPELPEVETVCRGLEQAILGATITQVTLRRGDLRAPFSKDFARYITGGRIQAITRRAKYILIALDNGYSILAHLGMSGRFSVEASPPKRYATHDHVVLTLNDKRVVIYNDARRFGRMDVVKTQDLSAHTLLSHLGPEPLSGAFNAAYLKHELLKRKAAVKVALMDQELVVGVGNIYASEALFLAKVNPVLPAHKAASKASVLIKTIRAVLESAIASGGSSLRDFVQLSGETGYFQHHFNVYGRAGKPCITCQTPIKTIRQAGRSTFYCPRCQR